MEAEQSKCIVDLPRGECLSAAVLFGFIEGLRFPGNTRILIPKDAVLEDVQWQTLARSRALRIAMQVYNKDGNNVFDYRNTDDLNKIENSDKAVLVRLWRVIESLDDADTDSHGGNSAASAISYSESDDLDQLVTLDQIAPLTGLSKRTLERYLSKGELPEADVPGGGGRAHKWLWQSIKPSLSKIAGRQLPDRFPGSRII